MAVTGPTTVDSTTVALGYAQIRVALASTYITSINAALSASDSIGTVTMTKFTSTIEYWKLRSGFPIIEDKSIPISEAAQMEVHAREIKPFVLAIARGLDPSGYTDAHSGEIALGNITAPIGVRMEAIYTYPETDYEMHVILPLTNVESSAEIDLQEAEAAAIPIIFDAKRADSGATGGNAVWDDKPLGRIAFIDNS